MGKTAISLASTRFGTDVPPVPWAEAGEPNEWGATWVVEIDTLADLARVSVHAKERLIVEFTDQGEVGEITIYDEYIE